MARAEQSCMVASLQRAYKQVIGRQPNTTTLQGRVAVDRKYHGKGREKITKAFRFFFPRDSLRGTRQTHPTSYFSVCYTRPR